MFFRPDKIFSRPHLLKKSSNTGDQKANLSYLQTKLIQYSTHAIFLLKSMLIVLLDMRVLIQLICEINRSR